LSFTRNCTGFDLVVAVHTDVHRRNGCILSFCNTCVTVFTVDLILTGVYLMRERDGLLRSVSFLNTYGEQRVNNSLKTKRRNDKGNCEYKAAAAGDRPQCNGRVYDFFFLFRKVPGIEETFNRRDKEHQDNNQENQDNNHPDQDQVEILR